MSGIHSLWASQDGTHITLLLFSLHLIPVPLLQAARQLWFDHGVIRLQGPN